MRRLFALCAILLVTASNPISANQDTTSQSKVPRHTAGIDTRQGLKYTFLVHCRIKVGAAIEAEIENMKSANDNGTEYGWGYSSHVGYLRFLMVDFVIWKPLEHLSFHSQANLKSIIYQHHFNSYGLDNPVLELEFRADTDVMLCKGIGLNANVIPFGFRYERGYDDDETITHFSTSTALNLCVYWQF